jgi:Xaa-Pro aminopeptidase
LPEDKLRKIIFSFLSITLIVTTGWCLSQDHSAFNKELYAERRQRLVDFMSEGILIFKNSEQNFNDFFYLTGIEEAEAAFLLSPGKEKRFIVFIQPYRPAREIWEGDRIGIQDAKIIYGADEAYPLEEFEKRLPQFLHEASSIYCSFNDLKGHETIREILGGLRQRRSKKVIDFIPYVHEMRMIKAPEEITLIQKAVDITCEAHRQAMLDTEPGKYEYEIEAVIEYIFRKNGASGPAFPSIVGSGPNSTILHYENNSRLMQEGDLLVIDIGAKYGNYSADVTRTLPVSGRFNKVQKEIYDLVLRAQEEAVEMVKPGIEIDEIHNHAISIIKNGLYKLGLITNKNSSWQIRVWLMYKISHWLGLHVHDVGDYKRTKESSRVLEPGMVFTIEPGIYIREKILDHLPEIMGKMVPSDEMKEFVKQVRRSAQKYDNIGVRIEDDVLVIENGCINLSKNAPKKIEDIEKLMNKAGPHKN